MKPKKMTGFPWDRGGRRRISDRRFRVAGRHAPERRTGWKRRSGWDRRYHPDQVLTGEERRNTDPGGPS